MTAREPKSEAVSAETLHRTEARARRVGSFVGYLSIGGAALYPVVTDSLSLTRQFLTIGLLAIVAVGLNFTMGFAGEFVIGQAGIFAAGAYTAGILTAEYDWNFWAALPFAMIVGTVVGLVAAAPGLRVGGWYFALTSLFVAVVIPDIARQAPHTGGTTGFGGIPSPAIGGHDLTLTQIYVFVAVSLAVLLALMASLNGSLWGLAFHQMRSSAKAAEASGISIVSTKVLVYAITSAVAAYAGAIFPHIDGYLAPDAFPLSLSILLVAGVVIGGLRTFIGPVVGIALLQLLPHVVSGFDRYSLLIYGSILIVSMLFLRDGLVPTVRDVWIGAVLALTGRVRPQAISAGTPRDSEATTSLDQPGDTVPVPRVTEATLALDGLSKRFEGTLAVDDVSLTAESGQITAIIGPNGSGKTTLLNLILGFYKPDGGRIRLGHRQLEGLRPHLVARAGVGRTFQTPAVILELSARDNVMAGMFTIRRSSFAAALIGLPSARRDRAEARQAAMRLLDIVGLGSVANVEAGTLSAGQQRLLEIARALATQPTVLLLDEPAAGLVGGEVIALAAVLRELRAAGYAIVLVEHNVPLVMSIADHVVALDSGSVIASGPPSSVQRDEAVIASYLGEATRA